MHMSAIIENLLTLAKADKGSTHLSMDDVWLRPLIRELFEDSEILAESKKITIRPGALDDALITGDPVRLRQLFLNLIDNAIKYTPEHGTVEISLTRTPLTAVVRITDSGIGIPPDELPKIFDRFYRVDKARSRELGGSGLGLSISKWIAEVHGGSITVESAVNSGSTFTVTLPLKPHSSQMEIFN